MHELHKNQVKAESPEVKLCLKYKHLLHRMRVIINNGDVNSVHRKLLGSKHVVSDQLASWLKGQREEKVNNLSHQLKK